MPREIHYSPLDEICGQYDPDYDDPMRRSLAIVNELNVAEKEDGEDDGNTV